MRRYLPYIAAVVVLIGLGIALYFYFINKDSGITAEPGVTNPFETVDGTGSSGVNGGQGSTDGIDESDWQVDSGDGSAWQADEVTPRLIKIATGPVAVGAAVLDRTDIASSTALGDTTTTNWLANIEVRYVMRASGNVFSYKASEGKNTRLSNRTIPGVQDAHWLADGSTAYLRFLAKDSDQSEHVESYAISADGTVGTLLARNLTSIDIAGTKLFTLMETTGGTSAAVSSADGSEARTAFTSPITGLRAEFLGSNFLAVTKPSSHLLGYAFSVSSAGTFNRILGPLRALSAIGNNAGTQVLASYVDGSTFHLGILTLADLSYRALPLQTLAEKCTFSPDGTTAYCAVPTLIPSGDLPDAWYQGTVSFTDRLWKIDFAARVTTLAADLPTLTKEPIDAVGLSMNPNGTAVVFTNRRDNSLWIYAI